MNALGNRFLIQSVQIVSSYGPLLKRYSAQRNELTGCLVLLRLHIDHEVLVAGVEPKRFNSRKVDVHDHDAINGPTGHRYEGWSPKYPRPLDRRFDRFFYVASI